MNDKKILNSLLRNKKGAVILETALVMPIFMLLLCFCVDIPRIISLRQRAWGAQKLISEIRARNNGTLTADANNMKNFFFDDNIASNVSVAINASTDRKTLISDVADLENWIQNDIWKFFTGVLKFLGNIITGGNLEPYFFNVFETDKLYSGSVTLSAPTILPSDAYNEFGKVPAPTTQISPSYTCYSPSLDSCKYTGESFVGKLIDWINNL
ncbi:MAG TPA: TadE/TadG family type IV pilus assembly protein [Victivallales bacterium]|nr:TadE/TadG family type IV pilus assembly protein [Victivallales bacterium]